MRAIAAIVLAAACLRAVPAAAQDQYAAVLLRYLTGDAGAAVTELAALPYAEINAGVEAFDGTRSRLILTGAAALHTEAAFRRDGQLASDYHLQIATAIVEFGEPAKGVKSNSRPKSIAPRFAQPVSDEFRRLWYCTVIQALESSVMLNRADNYLARALALYPGNPELRLLAGTAEEMRASPRTSNVSGGARRRALDQAEKEYRAVIAVEPDRGEARLRLGHVLQQRGAFAEARALLTPLTDARDSRIAYLALLFLGGVEDHEHHDDQALALYLRAVSRMSAGPGNDFDPWWTYAFGEYWRVDLLLSAIRGKRHV
jgi:tetratricopeptide (TPR) repeat protein